MIEYGEFAKFYDLVMDDPGPRAERIAEWIVHYHPRAASLLELGCGTGSILARLDSVPHVTGLDRSPEMLAVARKKVPGATLVEADMAEFELGRRFDVVACVFDTLNHLVSFDAWRTMFRTVHRHLEDDGLFLFDVNTVGELRRLGEEPPWVDDFEGGTAIIDVQCAENGQRAVLSKWDIRIFERIDGYQFRLHHEQIDELAVPLSLIRSALEPQFQLVEEVGSDGERPTDDSIKCHFAYRRQARTLGH